MFHYESSQNSTYLTNSESISLWYFVTQFFAAYKYIYDPLKALIANTNQTLKDGAVSGVGQSLLGILWLWFKFSGFSDS